MLRRYINRADSVAAKRVFGPDVEFVRIRGTVELWRFEDRYKPGPPWRITVLGAGVTSADALSSALDATKQESTDGGNG